MKSSTTAIWASCLTLGLLSASNLLAESAYVVTITDMRKVESYEVMTREQLGPLKEQIQEENRWFPAALTSAKKEWEANDLTKDSAFPSTGIVPRKMHVEGPLSMEMAKKKADKKNDREMERNYQNALAKPGSSKNKLSEKELEKLARKELKEKQTDAAAELVNKHLTDLIKGAK